jgi:conjugal transfer pilus assembly protein TraA
MKKHLLRMLPIAAILLIGLSANVFAGVDVTFADVETALTDWATGSLGRALAIGIFIVGVGVGIARQSLMAIVTGLGGAMALYYVPTVITNMVTAMIP